MPSISEILKGKTARDEARVTELRAERESLSYMRDGALEEITTKPDRYRQYLALQADNIRCSVGNVALTIVQMRQAPAGSGSPHGQKPPDDGGFNRPHGPVPRGAGGGQGDFLPGLL